MGAGKLQHEAHIAQVFIGATFAIEFELADDHVFRWRNSELLPQKRQFSNVLQRPDVQWIPAPEVEICFKAARDMQNVDMASLFAAGLNRDNVHGRTIEIFSCKC